MKTVLTVVLVICPVIMMGFASIPAYINASQFQDVEVILPQLVRLQLLLIALRYQALIIAINATQGGL
jgi:hypothetical protein